MYICITYTYIMSIYNMYIYVHTRDLNDDKCIKVGYFFSDAYKTLIVLSF